MNENFFFFFFLFYEEICFSPSVRPIKNRNETRNPYGYVFRIVFFFTRFPFLSFPLSRITFLFTFAPFFSPSILLLLLPTLFPPSAPPVDSAAPTSTRRFSPPPPSHEIKQNRAKEIKTIRLKCGSMNRIETSSRLVSSFLFSFGKNVSSKEKIAATIDLDGSIFRYISRLNKRKMKGGE